MMDEASGILDSESSSNGNVYGDASVSYFSSGEGLSTFNDEGDNESKHQYIYALLLCIIYKHTYMYNTYMMYTYIYSTYIMYNTIHTYIHTNTCKCKHVQYILYIHLHTYLHTYIIFVYTVYMCEPLF